LICPFVSLSARNAADCTDRPFLGLAWLARRGHRLLARTQTGKVRWYAAAVAVGAIVVVAVELFR
jgi:NADH-quinone oxidoreductase subunit L